MAFEFHSSNAIWSPTAVRDANPGHAGPSDFLNHQSASYQSIAAFQPYAMATTPPSSNNVAIPRITTDPKPNGWAAKEEWTRHRALIKQLYRDEKKPLPEVMRLLENQHGFRATVKMYKMHIKQWGLDKKNKESEMKAIVRKNKQRADQGKRSIIRVRGQTRDFAEVVRYWNRKGVSIDDIIARQTASPTPEAVDFSTPVPSPIMTPQVLAIPEQILLCIGDYFTGSFESGIWVKTEPTYSCYSRKDRNDAFRYMNELLMACELACSLFLKGLFHEAGQTLIIATVRIKGILLAEHPSSLPELLQCLFNMREWKRDDVAFNILRQFSAMGKILLGSGHPLSRISNWFSWVFASKFDDVVTVFIENVTDRFESFLGPMHASTIDSRINLIRSKIYSRSVRIQKMRKLLGECEKTLQACDIRTFHVRLHLADELYAEGHYADAETLSQRNIDDVRDLSAMNTESIWEIQGLYMAAKCEYALGEVDLGIATLREMIDMGMSKWGEQDSEVRQWLLRLEDWYCEQGLWDYAAQVRERSVKILESMTID